MRPRHRSPAIWPVVLALIVGACALRPPREAGTFREPDLVNLATLESSLRIDIRYATTNNFTGRAVYSLPRAYLQRPAAEAVVRAHAKLRDAGFGLQVYDAYRPWSVTRELWLSATPADRRGGFVADPRKGSRHNRGCAVDLTLYHLDTGAEASMPSAFDEFGERASPDYAGGDPDTRKRRDLLRSVMESEGFTVLPEEWWHFDFRDWREYRVLDVPFEALGP